MTTTYYWTSVGTEVVPLQHRAAFLAHLRGEITMQPAPEVVEWLDTTGVHPADVAASLRTAVLTFEISPVVKVAYNMTWMADQNTRQPGPSPDAEVLRIIAVQDADSALYFLDRGITITPIMIETPPPDRD